MKIAILLTGHSRWSEGMLAAHDLICGPSDQATFLNFNVEPQPLEVYQKNLRNIVTKFLVTYDEVWILTDLVGGYPFQQSALICLENPKVRVFGGINLSFIVQIDGEKDDVPAENTLEFIDTLVSESREALEYFVLTETETHIETDDGI